MQACLGKSFCSFKCQILFSIMNNKGSYNLNYAMIPISDTPLLFITNALKNAFHSLYVHIPQTTTSNNICKPSNWKHHDVLIHRGFGESMSQIFLARPFT